jgi:hypothetical protein
MHAGFRDGRRLSGVASFVQQMNSANGVGNAVEAAITGQRHSGRLFKPLKAPTIKRIVAR